MYVSIFTISKTNVTRIPLNVQMRILVLDSVYLAIIYLQSVQKVQIKRKIKKFEINSLGHNYFRNLDSLWFENFSHVVFEVLMKTFALRGTLRNSKSFYGNMKVFLIESSIKFIVTEKFLLFFRRWKTL